MILDPQNVATFCDYCGADIAYHETCYSIPNGRTHDNLPVVKIKCATCAGQS